MKAIPMLPRQLAAVYKFNDKTFVWQCDQCCKMFFLLVEEARFDGISRQIVLEFQSHACTYRRVGVEQDIDEDLGKPIIKMLRRDDEQGRE